MTINDYINEKIESLSEQRNKSNDVYEINIYNFLIAEYKLMKINIELGFVSLGK